MQFPRHEKPAEFSQQEWLNILQNHVAIFGTGVYYGGSKVIEAALWYWAQNAWSYYLDELGYRE